MSTQLLLPEVTGWPIQNKIVYLTSKTLLETGIIEQDLVQEREQDRDNDGSLGGLSKDDEKDGDREVVGSGHGFLNFLFLLKWRGLVQERNEFMRFLNDLAE